MKNKLMKTTSMKKYALAALCLACGASASSARAASFDVPKVQSVVIDGRADDWENQGLAVEFWTQSTQMLPLADSSCVVHLAWDERGLLVLANVRDDFSVEAKESFWEKDSVEMFVADARGGKNSYQVALSAGTSSEYSMLRLNTYDHRNDEALKKQALKVESARTVTPNGYVLEALLPWSNLQVAPSVGREIAFQFNLNDVDSDGQKTQSRWFPTEGAYSDTRLMMPLRLSNKASAPVRATATGEYQNFRRVDVRVSAAASLAGEKVALRDDKRVLATAVLQKDGEISSAKLTLPMPPRGQNYAPLSIVVNKKIVGALILPEAEATRQDIVRYAPVLFGSFVFEGEAFPSADFQQPSLMEDVLGRYSIETTFYDAAYNRVTRAEKPGRYGAVVQIKSANDAMMTRYLTLYRQPQTLNWGDAEIPFNVELPSAFGVDPDVTREQNGAVNRYLKWSLQGSFSNDNGGGSLLAGLSEATAGDVATRHRDPAMRDRNWWYGLKKKRGEAQPLRHLVDLPEGYGKESAKWPLVLFLHGAGEVGDDLNLVRRHGPPMLVASGKNFPFILVSPQLDEGTWIAPQLNDLLDEIAAKYRVDKDRIYVTGLSRGGRGTWELAMESPERFAAIAPMAIWGNLLGAERIKNLPTWYFVGGKDGSVPVAQTLKMDEAMKRVATDYKFTLYSEADHVGTWTQAYNDPQFYEWMLSHERR